MTNAVTIKSIAYNKYGDRVELLGDGQGNFHIVLSYEVVGGSRSSIGLHVVAAYEEAEQRFTKELEAFRDCNSSRAA